MTAHAPKPARHPVATKRRPYRLVKPRSPLQIITGKRNLALAREVGRHRPITPLQRQARRTSAHKAREVERHLKRTPAQLAASRRNLAKARVVAWHMARSPAQLAASRRNLIKARQKRWAHALRIHFRRLYVLGHKKGTIAFGRQAGLGKHLHFWGYKRGKYTKSKDSLMRFSRMPYHHQRLNRRR